MDALKNWFTEPSQLLAIFTTISKNTYLDNKINMTETKSKDSAFIHQSSLNDDRWLSVDEICKYLGVSKDTVYKWIDKHHMPAHRMGRLWKFKKEQVDAWIEAGGSASDSEDKK